MKVSRYRKEDDVTYALGATVAMEFLLGCPKEVNAVIIHPQFRAKDTEAEIESICKANNIPVYKEEKPFNILSQKENCYVIAQLRKHSSTIKPGNHVMLVNPSNAGNLGTIIRSCRGFGVEDIAIVPPAVDYWDPKTIRASMGAVAGVRVEVFEKFEDYQERFPENNLYPFMLDGSKKLQETEINGPFTLIMGNEATGLPDSYSKVGQPIRIEHTGAIDSLNLPIATSIGLYEATRKLFLK